MAAVLRWSAVPTLAEAAAKRSDNFLLLRFLAAALVIYGHGPAIAGGESAKDLFIRLGWGSYSGDIAVDLFFVISGFLVTGSFLRLRRVVPFLSSRALRILPAYAVCLIACAFVLGPAVTVLPLSDYFANRAPFYYVSINLHFVPDMAYVLPGVFLDNPQTSAVNGSIWTLPVEVRMYAVAAVLGACGILGRRALANALLVSSLLLPPAAFTWAGVTPRLALLFAAGMLCWINRDWIRVHWLLFAALALVAFLCRDTMIYPFAFGLAEVAFVFCFAYAVPWYAFNRFGDYSYGLYLWGYPMQQLVAHWAPALPSWQNAVGGFVLALAIAIASWHAVEEPSLRLKKLFRARADAPTNRD